MHLIFPIKIMLTTVTTDVNNYCVCMDMYVYILIESLGPQKFPNKTNISNIVKVKDAPHITHFNIKSILHINKLVNGSKTKSKTVIECGEYHRNGSKTQAIHWVGRSFPWTPQCAYSPQLAF